MKFFKISEFDINQCERFLLQYPDHPQAGAVRKRLDELLRGEGGRPVLPGAPMPNAQPYQPEKKFRPAHLATVLISLVAVVSLLFNFGVLHGEKKSNISDEPKPTAQNKEMLLEDDEDDSAEYQELPDLEDAELMDTVEVADTEAVEEAAPDAAAAEAVDVAEVVEKREESVEAADAFEEAADAAKKAVCKGAERAKTFTKGQKLFCFRDYVHVRTSPKWEGEKNYTRFDGYPAVMCRGNKVIYLGEYHFYWDDGFNGYLTFIKVKVLECGQDDGNFDGWVRIDYFKTMEYCCYVCDGTGIASQTDEDGGIDLIDCNICGGKGYYEDGEIGC